MRSLHCQRQPTLTLHYKNVYHDVIVRISARPAVLRREVSGVHDVRQRARYGRVGQIQVGARLVLDEYLIIRLHATSCQVVSLNDEYGCHQHIFIIARSLGHV